MIDDLVAMGWTQIPPERGGVRRACRTMPARGRVLTVEERAGQWWIWLEEDDECRVISIQAHDPSGAARALVSMQQELSPETYLTHYGALGSFGNAEIVAYEQFEQPYENQIEPPGDAMYKYFSDVIASSHGPLRQPQYSANLPDSEPPSAMTALRLAMADVQPTPQVTYQITNPPFPDQRAPKARVDYVLFRHDGQFWQPNVKPPAPQVVEALSRFCTTGFSADEWFDRGRQAGAFVGQGWPHLLGVIAHGSPVPPGFNAFNWVQRLQLAACFTLAHVGAGWGGSLRRRALYNIALGPVDWCVDAAIVVLAKIATREPETRRDIESLFAYLKRQVGRPGFTCYAAPLAVLWLRLGGHSEAAKASLAEFGREAWHGGTKEPASPQLRAAIEDQRARLMAVNFASPDGIRIMEESSIAS